MGGFNYTFIIDEEMSKPMDFMSDESYAFQFLLSSIGNVAVTTKVVSVRGMPVSSSGERTNYSKNPQWGRDVGQAHFMSMINVCKAELTGQYSDATKKAAREWLFFFPVRRINLKIIRHYKYDLGVIYLMIKSFIKYKTIKIKENMKRIIKAIYQLYNGELNFEIIKKRFMDKVNERGIYYVIKRILLFPIT